MDQKRNSLSGPCARRVQVIFFRGVGRNTTALWLVIWLMGFAAIVRAAKPEGPLLGEGAQRLVGGAVKAAHAQWDPDACLAGVDIDINLSKYSMPPGPKTVYLNSFDFYFYRPDKAMPKYVVGINEALGAYLNNPAMPITYNLYEGRVSDNPTARVAIDGSCVTEMSVDSGKALAIAVRNGLASDPAMRYRAVLRAAKETGSKHWTEPALAGRAFWIVRDHGALLDYYIDAKTGRFLFKRKP